MPGILGAVEYGGYISPIKLAVYLILFFGGLPVVCWVHRDAEALGTKSVFWTGVVFGIWAAAGIIWLLIPVFLIGTVLYLIAAGAASIAYIMHRDALVPEFQRVLSVDHIKGLFTSQAKKTAEMQSFVFITSNNNEVPMPEPKTPDFFGYKAAYDLFSDAIYRRAYDIVCAPTLQNYNISYYVDGAALKQPTLPKDRMDYLLHFVKHLANLDVEEKRKPQKGKFTVFQNNRRIEWEVTTAGSTAGEQLRVKQLTQQDITKVGDLGLTTEQLEQMNSLQHIKSGLVIISGPKKSGVTTTLYTLLRSHDAFLSSIATVERQPSGKLPNITQNVFSLSDSGVTTYAKKLQSIIRTDPDIIAVADCGDAGTAQIACSAAISGKLVYVELEEDTLLKALAKWIKLVGDKNKAISPLLGISNQRIFRKLCDECKQAYEPNREMLHKFNIPADKVKVFYKAGKVVYDKRGRAAPCENCQETGYFGRMAAFETVFFNEKLRAAAKQAKSLQDIGTEFRRARMRYLQEQVLMKVIAGVTSINEMVRILSRGGDQRQTAE